MDGTVVHYQPFLTVSLLFQLIYFFEHFKEEFYVLVLSVGSFDNTPVGKSFLADDSDQGESFSLGDGAVHCDLLFGTGPGFLSGHVQVES